MQSLKDTIKEVIFAVLPVAVVVILLQIIIVRLPWIAFGQFLVGLIMVVTGLILFLLGVHFGLLPVGELIGSVLPQQGKVWMVIFFGFLFGFVVTVAEPDVRVLAIQVDLVSGGDISSNLLIYTVALGVALFVGLAMARVIYNIPLPYLLVLGYGLVFLVAALGSPKFMPISFDAGGVTTGPLTVPFVIALGMGVTSVMGGKSATKDGFGLVGLASIGPILAVLILGVIFA